MSEITMRKMLDAAIEWQSECLLNLNAGAVEIGGPLPPLSTDAVPVMMPNPNDTVAVVPESLLSKVSRIVENAKRCNDMAKNIMDLLQ